MSIEGMLADPWTRNLAAAGVTFGLMLVWLRSMDALAHRGRLSPRLSRKIIHIGTGPFFVACWTLFSEAPQARWLASLIPLAITTQFALVGLGVIDDPAAVQAMSRSGDRREILRGPLYYGLVFVIVTLVFWRHSAAGILALMVLCGGDGVADLVGRRFGKRKIPWSHGKTWAGSAGMFLGSIVFGLGALALFNALGYFVPALQAAQTVLAVALIAFVATIVESLPLKHIDNLTTTLATLAASWLLIQPLGLWQATFL